MGFDTIVCYTKASRTRAQDGIFCVGMIRKDMVRPDQMNAKNLSNLCGADIIFFFVPIELFCGMYQATFWFRSPI